MKLLLASGSPRRRNMLEELGIEFEWIEPDVDESRFPGEDPDRYVERLARAKAESCAAEGLVSIGADTTVVHHGVVMGKPAHPAEALTMLRALAGEKHTVHSGVAVARFTDGELVVHSAVERTVVTMVDLTNEEIAAYVATGEPLDKAGAYALQGRGALFVAGVDGSPSNVIGLPLHRLAALLRSVGVDLLAGPS